MTAKLTLFISTRAISQAVVKAIHALRAVEIDQPKQQNPYFTTERRLWVIRDRALWVCFRNGLKAEVLRY